MGVRSGSTRAATPGALLAAGLLTLAACGGSGDDAIESTDSTTSTTTTTAVTAPPTTLAPAPTTVAPAPTTVAPPPATVAPATTAAPATTTSTTTAPSTTAAPTTTAPTTAAPTTTIARDAEPAAQPMAPPTDPHAHEAAPVIGRISIPKLDVSMEMYSGIRLPTLDLGPGHWPGTALPGQVGNVVVGGHRTSGHRVFRDVDQLVPGDEVVFDDDAGRHVYAVREVRIVEPTDIWIIDPTDTPTATLFACHPPGSVAQRIVVFADLVA